MNATNMLIAVASVAITMGQTKKKGSPTVVIGSDPSAQLTVYQSNAATLLHCVNDPTSLASLREHLLKIVTDESLASVKSVAPVTPVTPPTTPVKPVTPPAQPSLTPSETLDAIKASLETAKNDAALMRGKHVPQALPRETVKPSATIEVKVTDDASERAALITEGRSLGMAGIQAYGLKMSMDGLRAKVASARPVKVTPPAKQTAPKAETPKPIVRKTLLADFVNTMPDGREVYTAIYSDGSSYVEVTGTARKVA